MWRAFEEHPVSYMPSALKVNGAEGTQESVEARVMNASVDAKQWSKPVQVWSCGKVHNSESKTTAAGESWRRKL